MPKFPGKFIFAVVVAGLAIAWMRLFIFNQVQTIPPSPEMNPVQAGTEQVITPDRESEVAATSTSAQPIFPSPSGKQLAEFQEEGEEGGYRVIQEDDTGFTLEISIPEYRLEAVTAGDSTLQEVTIPGFFSLEEPGRPSLPVRTLTIPLPGVSSIEVTASSSPDLESGEVNLAAAPSDQWVRREIERIWIKKTLQDERLMEALPENWQSFTRERGKALETAESLSPVEDVRTGEVSAEDALYPARIVESSGPLWAGDEQFLSLRIAPVQYSSSTRRLISRQLVTVDVKYGASIKELPKREQPDYGAQFALAGSDSFRAEVNQDGIHTITYQNLADAGFNVGQDPRSLRMYLMGQEIDIHIQGQEDGTWDPGDYIDFYGQGNTDFYSQTNVYWLYQTSGAGRRMSEVISPACGRPSRQEHFLDTLHLEQRVSYRPYLPVGTGNDCWFWGVAGQVAGTDIPSTITFSLTGVSDWKGTAAFSGRYFGYTTSEAVNPDHHTQVYLNGHLVGDFFWDGQTWFTLQTDIPQDTFNEGTNTILTREVNDLGLTADYIFVDSFDLSFYRDYRSKDNRLTFTASGKGDYRINNFGGGNLDLYDITVPSSPRKITDFTVDTASGNSLVFRKWDADERQYCALWRTAALAPVLTQNTPADLSAPRVVDYIIVTHPDFAAALPTLAAFREETAQGGFRVETFEIQDIYNTFGFGNFTPYAINRFLEYAYTEWDTLTRPQYALLVGDGNYDYRNDRGLGIPNYVPPYMFRSRYMETASDNWYVCFIGDDRIPDMNIGRLCVTSFAETTQEVGKILCYAAGTNGLPWQSQILMVADNPDPAAGDFPADSNWLIANYVPPAFTAQTAYLADLGVAATRSAIINGINSGQLLVNYLGHGSATSWSSSEIFKTTNIASLTNAERLHLLVTPTCLNGYWCELSTDCLAEAMTLTPGKGSIAAVSPTGLSLNTPALQLTGFLFRELLTNGRACGPALTQAKIQLAGVSPWLYMLDIYTLFGDPALELK